MNKTEQLIEALQKERDLFEKRDQSTKDHDAAIEFLENGWSDIPDYRYDLLDAVRYDFE